ncbi:M23 family metallopeptidase [Arcanobacterium buesumense]|uniref:M23 family metallopeptidase n=1 Tax=Arcanobacterium buesumense TaxID=2722751 RepID=A0A6H2EJI5_9ACTO|nr:M23 family metallopeptidase [Arcanobacterium buesumense]QJC21360.1 M23 family metallopeptidase [Arcanobacterium buesumense]
MSEQQTRPSRRDLRLARQAQQASTLLLDDSFQDNTSMRTVATMSATAAQHNDNRAGNKEENCQTQETVVLPSAENIEPASAKVPASTWLTTSGLSRFFLPQWSMRTLASASCAFFLAVGGGIGIGSFVFESSAAAYQDDSVLEGIAEEGADTPSNLKALSGAADSARFKAYEEQFAGKPVLCETTASANSLTSVLRNKLDRFIHPMAAGTFQESSPFGWRLHPILGTSKLHEGVDYAAPLGTPIYAVADGKVVFSGANSATLGAPILIIEHNVNGVIFTSWYLHSFSEGIHVREGDEVKMGDHVADVGNSGRSTGPHLHFEIHPGPYTGLDGAGPVDPTEFMKDHGAVDIHDICGAK